MKKIRKIVVVLLMAFLLTGCTEQLRDENKKPVTVDGKTLTANILCQPTKQSVIDKYLENDIDVTTLPKCNEFKITDGGYEGIWTSVLVKPFAAFLIFLVNIFNNAGLAVVFVGILLRAIMIPMTRKTQKQSEMMKKAKPEIDRIEKKYKDKTDQASLMQKSQETMAVYKKYNFNPVSGCLFAFIQLPIFFVMLEAINRVPVIFEGTFLGLDLGTTPAEAFSKGNFWYLILVIVIGITTHLQFQDNNTGGAQAGQMQFMMKFMVIMILFSSLYFPTALAIYWITSGLFAIVQTIILKRSDKEWKSMSLKEKTLTILKIKH